MYEQYDDAHLYMKRTSFFGPLTKAQLIKVLENRSWVTETSDRMVILRRRH